MPVSAQSADRLRFASGGDRGYLSAADPDEFPKAELVVTPAPGQYLYSWPSISFHLVGSGKLRIEVLVAVTDSSGDMEDTHDTFESLARGFCFGRDVSVVHAFSFEDEDYYVHNVYLALDRRGARDRRWLQRGRLPLGAVPEVPVSGLFGEGGLRQRLACPVPAGCAALSLEYETVESCAPPRGTFHF